MSEAGELPLGAAQVGLVKALGLSIEDLSGDRVTGRLVVDERHLQPYGLVHGGVYCSIAETLASLGAWLNARRRDPETGSVGLENHTTFLRAARQGTEVVAEATPLHAGARTQSWTVIMRDAATGRALATSNVRLLILEPDTL